MVETESRVARATTRISAPPRSIKNSGTLRGCTGAPTSCDGGGFTLIEILVVLVIIAIAISFAVLSIGVTGRDRELDEESRRIEGLIGLLQERAVLEGRDFGLLVEPTRYQFVVFQSRRQRWESFDQEREFRRRDLPKGLSFELSLDGRLAVLHAPDEQLKSDAPQTAPQLIIAASGEGTPFRLTLLRAGTESRATVSADAFGRLKVDNSDQSVKRT
jgi:general secretion pathway protein H